MLTSELCVSSFALHWEETNGWTDALVEDIQSMPEQIAYDEDSGLVRQARRS